MIDCFRQVCCIENNRTNKLEAVLSQTDRATRCISRNLVHSGVVQTTTNRSNRLRVTVDRRVVKSHDASIVVGVVNKLDRRRDLLKTRSTTKLSLGPEFGTKFQREVPLFLEMPEFPYNTVYDIWKKVSVLKTSSILPVVSVQYRLVTDGRTDGQANGQTRRQQMPR